MNALLQPDSHVVRRRLGFVISPSRLSCCPSMQFAYQTAAFEALLGAHMAPLPVAVHSE